MARMRVLKTEKVIYVGLLLLAMCAIETMGQYYGRSVPCPNSYLDSDSDCLPGIAGKDYPLYSVIPATSFKCKDQRVKFIGYFADVETECQVYHVCLRNGRQDTFLCPNGTMFNQQVLICDWWFHVKCAESPSYYEINNYLQLPVDFHPSPVHPNQMPIPYEFLKKPQRQAESIYKSPVSNTGPAENNNWDIAPPLRSMGDHSSSLSPNEPVLAVASDRLETIATNIQPPFQQDEPDGHSYQVSEDSQNVMDYNIQPRILNRPTQSSAATTTTTTTTTISGYWDNSNINQPLPNEYSIAIPQMTQLRSNLGRPRK